MNLWSRLTMRFGRKKSRFFAISMVAILTVASTGTLLIQTMNKPEGTTIQEVQSLSSEAGDADADGLADVVENLAGSDAQQPATLGNGVLDGWVYYWYSESADWSDPSLLNQTAMRPPQDLVPPPLRSPHGLVLPTVAEVFHLDSQGRNTTAWWTGDSVLDPTQWDNDADGIADAWLIMYGLNPFDVRADGPAPGDAGMTVREKYELGLDPTRSDSDRDGLDDLEELSGEVELNGKGVTFAASDPTTFSTRSDGIPDGFIVRIGMNPQDSTIHDRTPVPTGLSVRQAAHATEQLCKGETQKPCNWSHQIRSGPIIDPNKWDTNNDGVPDAWIVEEAGEVANVLDDAANQTMYNSTQWDGQAHAAGTPGPGLVVDDYNPTPSTPFEVTLADLYHYGKPSNWSEEIQGPWWGGLPVNLDSPNGSLPVPVALRGWTIQVDTCRGCNSTTPEEFLSRITAHSDPRSSDSDDDGLLDVEEYMGFTQGQPIPRTNPLAPDTDSDGLTDNEELASLTNPLRRDTAGSFLSDGESHTYWSAAYSIALDLLGKDPQKAAIKYEFLLGSDSSSTASLTEAHLKALQPNGTLHGESPNILSADSDGDGIRDGAELYPNLYLEIPTTDPRPATNPARTDSDGDQLPDAWEIRWSSTRFYGCSNPCVSPVPGFSGWPINPARFDSFDPSVTEANPSQGTSDYDRNLKGDQVRISPGQHRPFSNGLAYEYDLHPYQRDSSPSDGISDMFALHWGITAIPAAVQEMIDESLDAGESTWAWVKSNAERIEQRRPLGGDNAVTLAVMDPGQSNPNINLESNLQGMFYSRNKGTWVVDPSTECENTVLPSTGHQSEQGLGGKIPDRQRTAPCWKWVEYDLQSDIENATNPWSHDFDEDGLPDAWEAHYLDSLGATGGAVIPSSTGSGCRDPSQTVALPPAAPENPEGHCLTYLEAYREGIDPTQSDTDQGGIADWLELASGRDPLDAEDDFGQEDWDADGLSNGVEAVLGTSPFTPDSDRDGLLDGDPLGIQPSPFLSPNNGFGDLCLRTGPDNVTGMTHRPSLLASDDPGGNLTHTQVVQWLISEGIIHDGDPGNRCPAPQIIKNQTHPFILFKREGALDRWNNQGQAPDMLGAGRGTDSLDWDTAGDGIPDGWVVYWRDAERKGSNSNDTQAALDARDPATAFTDPDQDGLPTLDEYTMGRPRDWVESRDGPWWAGANPASSDSDGDRVWFRSTFEGSDVLDSDLDADGLPLTIDPYPGIDPANQGTIKKDGSGYHTDYTSLWENLTARSERAFADNDEDLVPDALDHARVSVSATFARNDQPLEALSKTDNEPVQVTGIVLINEEPESDRNYNGDTQGAQNLPDAAVEGATVKAILSDDTHLAVVGAGTTGSDGRFSFEASTDTLVEMNALPHQASIHGQIYSAGEAPVFASETERLTPGPSRLWVTVEANDPRIQPVSFDGQDSVVAYKTVSPTATNPASFPSLEPGTTHELKAVRITNSNGPVPDQDTHDVKHGTNSIWVGHSTPLNLDLRTATGLEANLDPPTPIRGEPMTISGHLTDGKGTGLAERGIQIQITTGTFQVSRNIQTGSEGVFTETLETGDIPLGDLSIKVHATLTDEDRFLDPPAPAEITSTLAQSSYWEEPFLVGGSFYLDGASVPLDPEEETTVSGTLIESTTQQPLSQQDIRIELSALEPQTLLYEAQATTTADGQFQMELPPLPSHAPRSILRLALTTEEVTPMDETAEATLFLKPRFETKVSLDNGTASVGSTATIKGNLFWTIGENRHALSGAHGIIHVQGEEIHEEIAATGLNGTFQFTTTSQTPGSSEYTLWFEAAPDSLLQDSSEALANLNFTAPTRIRMQAEPAVVGSPLVVTGNLTWGDGRAIDGMPINLSTAGQNLTATTDDHGFFQAELPAPTTHGSKTVQATFAGSSLFEPTTQSMDTVVRRPTILVVNAENTTVQLDEPLATNVAATLESQGEPLPGKSIEFLFTSPTNSSFQVLRTTDGTGQAEVSLQDIELDAPGRWSLHVAFAQTTQETSATNNTKFTVEAQAAIDLIQVPSTIRTGQRLDLSGRILAPEGINDQITLVVEWNGKQEAGTTVGLGDSWKASFSLPETPPGKGTLRLYAEPGDSVQVDAVQTTITVQGTISIQMDISERANGSRQVQLQLVDEKEAPVHESMSVVLAQRASDQRIVRLHEAVTAANGTATLELPPDQGGGLEILQLGTHTYDLDGIYVDVMLPQNQVAQDPSSKPTGVLVWATIIALAVAGAVTISYSRWTSKTTQDLRQFVADAHRRILDRKAPVAISVRTAYQSLLQLLEAHGYQPQPTDTVRAVCKSAEDAFGLPHHPWRALSRLFEKATFSASPLSENDRDTAEFTFRTLAERLEGTSKEGTP